MARQPIDASIKRTADRRVDALPQDRRPLRERATQGSPDKAAGTVTQPISPGEAQPGDLNEQAGNLGGPVDIFPLNQGPARETSEG